MKKLIIAVSLLSIFNSCTSGGSGSGTSVTPASSFSITFRGHTYTSTTPVATTAGGSSGWMLSFNGGTLTTVVLIFQGWNYFNLTSGIGTYKLGGISNGIHYSANPCTLSDYASGGAAYRADATDTTSQAIVTISNGTECKGTFTVNLNDGAGNYYPATGSFDYIKP